MTPPSPQPPATEQSNSLSRRGVIVAGTAVPGLAAVGLAGQTSPAAAAGPEEA